MIISPRTDRFVTLYVITVYVTPATCTYVSIYLVLSLQFLSWFINVLYYITFLGKNYSNRSYFLKFISCDHFHFSH